jgi:hypothetical protein
MAGGKSVFSSKFSFSSKKRFLPKKRVPWHLFFEKMKNEIWAKKHEFQKHL